MIQLQSRKVAFIGEPEAPWQVDDEATIVTKAMRREVRLSSSIGGEREIRIVNTKVAKAEGR